MVNGVQIRLPSSLESSDPVASAVADFRRELREVGRLATERNCWNLFLVLFNADVSFEEIRKAIAVACASSEKSH